MIVLDCNAVIAMMAHTEEGEALKSLIQTNERILAPSVYCEEVVHVIEKRVNGGFLAQEEAITFGQACLSFVDEFYDGLDLWQEALDASVQYQHSSYDMFYLVLARRKAATLFTLDRSLQQVCREARVNCIEIDDEF